MQHRLKKDEATGEIESSVGPRGKSFQKGGKEALPRAVSKGFVQKADTKVLGQKGASSETQDFSDVELNQQRGVEKEDLGFVLVDVHS